MKEPNMTDPKPRRFTADEMEHAAKLLEISGQDMAGILLRQAAETERRLTCRDDLDGEHAILMLVDGYTRARYFKSDDCPACLFRRAAGLEES